MRHTLTAALTLFVGAAVPLSAQWPTFPTPGPKTGDGKVDPKAYTKPFTATVNNRLLPDTQLIEFVCIDKSAQHYVGADGKK